MWGKDKTWRQLSWETTSGLIFEPADVRGRPERPLLRNCPSLAAEVGSWGLSSSPIWSNSQTSVKYSGMHQHTTGRHVISDLESSRQYFHYPLWKLRSLSRSSHLWTPECALPDWTLRQVLMSVEWLTGKKEVKEANTLPHWLQSPWPFPGAQRNEWTLGPPLRSTPEHHCIWAWWHTLILQS